MKNYSKSLIFLCLTLFFTSNSYAFEVIKSIEEEYYDFLSLKALVERPSLGYRTLSDSTWNFIEENTEHIWMNNKLGSKKILWESKNKIQNSFFNGINQDLKLKIFGPESFNSINTNLPYGQNDRSLWQGKGFNTNLSFGFMLETYGFNLIFKPDLSFSQNLSFSVNENIYKNPYSNSFFSDYFTHYIDYVKRYGDESFFDFNFGDSEIRWNWKAFTIGFGTQSPWLGPAYLNPMLGSNNASPYWKIDLGLRKTKISLPYYKFNLGYIEFRLWNGRLEESKYFGIDKESSYRMLNGLSFSYMPSFIPGLTLGFNRIYMTKWAKENYIFLLKLFINAGNSYISSGNDEDQKVALFFDWCFPKIGFEVYGEYGFDDFGWNKKTNPFHTGIYSLGVKQRIPLNKDLESLLVIELNNFEMSQDFQLEWDYLGYYCHKNSLRQGYTNKGQIIGAGSGSFGNSQYIEYKVYGKRFTSSLYFHRYCPNKNSVYSIAVKNVAKDINKAWYDNYEAYFNFGIKGSYFLTDSIILSSNIVYTRVYNKDYEINSNVNNFYIALGGKINF